MNYRSMTIIILSGSVLIIALSWMLSFLNAWLVLSLLAINLALLAGGSFRVCSNLYINAHCNGSNTEKKIALTFDDGPHRKITPLLLDILKNNNIQAAFFLSGKDIDGNEVLLNRMLDEGHVIGNHSYSHRNTFGFLSTAAVIRDLQRNEALIMEITRKNCALFRPPMGITNPHIAKAVRYLNYDVVGWSIRSLDTVHKDPAKVAARVARRLRPGRVILLHDTQDNAAILLKQIIEKAAAGGYAFERPDRLLNLNAYK